MIIGFILYILFFAKISEAPIIPEPLKNLVWCPDKCFYISENGLVLGAVPELKGSFITSIKSESSPSSETLEYLNSIKKNFEELNDLKIKEIFLGDNTTVKAMMFNDWYVLFDKESSPEKLAMLLQTILEKEIKEKIKNLEYIDLRLENRAYYKLK